MNNPDVVMERVDTSNVEVPTYAIFGATTFVCPMDYNTDHMNKIPTLKKTITYEGDNALDTWDFHKQNPRITSDVVMILNGESASLHLIAVAATSVLTLLSLV